MKTKKLSKSQSSKKYLESKYGVCSKPISLKVQRKLENAGQLANEKIKRNDIVYKQSNVHSNEYILRTNSFYEANEELGISERSEEEFVEYSGLIGMPLSEDYDERIASITTPRRVLKKEDIQSL